MKRHRGAWTIAFGVIICVAGVLLFAPVVQDGFSDGATAPAIVERDLAAGQWLVFEEQTGVDRAITGITITSDTGLSFPADMLQPSNSILLEPAETIDTADGTFVIVAALDIPRDGTWTLDIKSDRPTEILISPGLARLNQLGVGVVFVIMGLMTAFVGVVVLISDASKRNRRPKPGKTISPPIAA